MPILTPTRLRSYPAPMEYSKSPTQLRRLPSMGMFHREYAVHHKLPPMARNAGLRMSMRYDPDRGAIAKP